MEATIFSEFERLFDAASPDGKAQLAKEETEAKQRFTRIESEWGKLKDVVPHKGLVVLPPIALKSLHRHFGNKYEVKDGDQVKVDMDQYQTQYMSVMAKNALLETKSRALSGDLPLESMVKPDYWQREPKFDFGLNPDLVPSKSKEKRPPKVVSKANTTPLPASRVKEPVKVSSKGAKLQGASNQRKEKVVGPAPVLVKTPVATAPLLGKPATVTTTPVPLTRPSPPVVPVVVQPVQVQNTPSVQVAVPVTTTALTVADSKSLWDALFKSKFRNLDLTRFEAYAIAAHLQSNNRRRRFIIEWLKKTLHDRLIAVGDPSLIDWAKKLGFKAVLGKNAASCGHAKAKAARQIAESIAQEYLFDSLISNSDHTGMIDLWGATRVRKFYDEEFKDRFDSNVWLAGLDLSFDWFRPIVTGKDATEYTDHLKTWPSRKGTNGDVALITDVYAPVLDLFNTVSDMRITSGVVVTQLYSPEILAGQTFERGVYYSSENGASDFTHISSVNESPSQFNSFNYEYLTNQVLPLANGDVAVFEVKRAIEDYVILSFRITRFQLNLPRAAIYVAPPKHGLIEVQFIKPHTFWEKLKIGMNFLNWRGPTVYNRPLRCFRPAITELFGSMSLKSRMPFQVAAVTARVESSISDRQYEQFWSLLPPEIATKQEVLLETMMYLSWAHAAEESKQWNQAVEQYAEPISVLKKAKNHIFTPPVPTFSASEKVLIGLGTGVAVCSIALLGYYKWKRTSGTFSLLSGNVFPLFGSYFEENQRSICELKLLEQASEAVKSVNIPAEVVSATTLEWAKSEFQKMIDNALFVSGAFVIYLLSPIWEERFKAWLPHAGAMLLAVIESIGALHIAGPLEFAKVLLFKVAFHWLLCEQVSPNPTASHAAWNVAAGITLYLPSGEFWPKIPAIAGSFGAWLWARGWADPFSWGVFGGGLGFCSQFTVIFPWVKAHADLIHQMSLDIIAKQAVSVAGMLLSQAASTSTAVVVTLGLMTEKLFKRKPKDCEVVEAWKTAYKDLEHVDMEFPIQPYPVLHQSYQIAVEDAYLPANSGEYCTPTDAYDGSAPPMGMYLLATPSVQFVRPYGYDHFLNAYRLRNLKEVIMSETCEEDGALMLPEGPCRFTPNLEQYMTQTKLSQCPLGLRWQILTQQFVPSMVKVKKENLGTDTFPRMKRAEWARKYPDAMRRMRAKQSLLDRHEFTATSTFLFLKNDEVLWPRVQSPPLKPRTIKGMDPTLQAEAGVYFDRAMTILKRTCDHSFEISETPLGFDGKHAKWSVSFTVGSGLSVEELSSWFTEALELVGHLPAPSYIGIFSGDDEAGMGRDVHGKFYFIESDKTAFDRSQGVHALDLEKALAVFHGEVPEGVVKRLFKAVASTPSFEDKRLGIKRSCPMPIQRSTGGPDTSYGNTVDCMACCYYSIKRGDFPYTAGLSASELGFESKLKFHEQPEGTTFLKGWWVPVNEFPQDEEDWETESITHATHVWMPLPSAAVKLGKVMTNPCFISPDCEALEAWKRTAKAIACGYEWIPEDYPILGATVHGYLRLTSVDVAVYHEAKREHKPRPGSETFMHNKAIDWEHDYSIANMIESRYHLTRYETDQAAFELNTALCKDMFPVLLTNPIYKQLAEADYS